MTRSKEPELVCKILTPSIHEPIPQLQLNGFPTLKYNYLPYQLPQEIRSQRNLPEMFYVYLWASTDDYLPFYCGMGTAYQIVARHKYPGGTITTQQMYRDLCGDSFICILLSPQLNNYHAQSLLHYTYNHYSQLAIPTSQTKEAIEYATQQQSNHSALITMRNPEIPEHLTKYTPINKIPRPLPSPPESQGIRMGRQEQLRSKLLKWITNKEYQNKKAAK